MKDGQSAHAATIRQALEELAFKTGKRDLSAYKNLPIDMKKTPSEWAFVYRIVTGACQYGTEQFMKSKGKLKKNYSLEEIIQQTNGAFGHGKFVSIVTGKAA